MQTIEKLNICISLCMYIMFYVMLVYGLFCYVVSYIVCWCIFHNIDYLIHILVGKFKEKTLKKIQNSKRPFSHKTYSLLTKPNKKCPFCYVHHTHSHSHTSTIQKDFLSLSKSKQENKWKPSTVKKWFYLNEKYIKKNTLRVYKKRKNAGKSIK